MKHLYKVMFNSISCSKIFFVDTVINKLLMQKCYYTIPFNQNTSKFKDRIFVKIQKPNFEFSFKFICNDLNFSTTQNGHTLRQYFFKFLENSDLRKFVNILNTACHKNLGNNTVFLTIRIKK